MISLELLEVFAVWLCCLYEAEQVAPVKYVHELFRQIFQTC